MEGFFCYDVWVFFSGDDVRSIGIFVKVGTAETALFYFCEDFIVFWGWDGDFIDADIEFVVEASCSHHGAVWNLNRKVRV